MRIFIMFGTQDKRFDRLLDAVLTSNFIKENEVYMQLGYTTGNYSGVHVQQYYSEEELIEQISLADLVITHAGVGAIVSALKLLKRTIVVPRLGKYKEQNNDHQVQIMNRYKDMGYIIAMDDLSKIDEVVAGADQFIPKPYTIDKQAIIEEIYNFIKLN